MAALVHLFKPSRGVTMLGALALLASVIFAAQSATAQSATGTVTGRVLWGSCIRGIPLPMMPDGQPQPGMATPDPAAPDAQIAPGSRPTQVNGLPAGAVLVAAQNTAVNARTDEAGKFTLSGVPAGQYLTVAAGPVADSTSATADRPNVYVSGGQSVDIGTLSLGGSAAPAYACRFPNGVDGPMPGAPNTSSPDGTPATPAP
ncbi:MAG: carboxypeptidase-like regulatory domain-containing protein [Chloroflexota bacterium]|nr:carboxypeptidase-like regulatory domain-containing protein [Chloroflexota bacterium]